MVIHQILQFAALAVAILQLPKAVFVVVAEKDSDYYIPGFTNPNVKHKMYWKDSLNVLQDLDQFESLYISYHSCVWSYYGRRYGNGQNYDEQGANQDDYDALANNCGGWGGETFWYMGRTPCFKANVAYSLYGILKDDGSSNNEDDNARSRCTKKTYINSFFTTYGVESFTGPMGLSTDMANSQCNVVDDDDGAYYKADDTVKADDDFVGDDFVLYDYTQYLSMGTSCSNRGNFVLDTYQGAFCNSPANVESTSDALDDLNQALRDMDCTQIYSASSQIRYGDYDDDVSEEFEDDNYNAYYANYGDDDDGITYEGIHPINILKHSQSCSIRQYPGDCPDPHGLLKKYTRALENELAYFTGRKSKLWHWIISIVSYSSLFVGVALMGIAIGKTRRWKKFQRRLRRQVRRRRRQNEKRRRRKSKERKKTRSYKPMDEETVISDDQRSTEVQDLEAPISDKQASSKTKDDSRGTPDVLVPPPEQKGAKGGKEDAEKNHRKVVKEAESNLATNKQEKQSNKDEKEVGTIGSPSKILQEEPGGIKSQSKPIVTGTIVPKTQEGQSKANPDKSNKAKLDSKKDPIGTNEKRSDDKGKTNEQPKKGKETVPGRSLNQGKPKVTEASQNKPGVDNQKAMPNAPPASNKHISATSMKPAKQANNQKEPDKVQSTSRKEESQSSKERPAKEGKLSPKDRKNQGIPSASRAGESTTVKTKMGSTAKGEKALTEEKQQQDHQVTQKQPLKANKILASKEKKENKAETERQNLPSASKKEVLKSKMDSTPSGKMQHGDVNHQKPPSSTKQQLKSKTDSTPKEETKPSNGTKKVAHHANLHNPLEEVGGFEVQSKGLLSIAILALSPETNSNKHQQTQDQKTNKDAISTEGEISTKDKELQKDKPYKKLQMKPNKDPTLKEKGRSRENQRVAAASKTHGPKNKSDSTAQREKRPGASHHSDNPKTQEEFGGFEILGGLQALRNGLLSTAVVSLFPETGTNARQRTPKQTNKDTEDKAGTKSRRETEHRNHQLSNTAKEQLLQTSKHSTPKDEKKKQQETRKSQDCSSIQDPDVQIG